jgi:D-alanine-D-alanine ligase
MEKIFVLMGGTSNEREVSLESGRNVVEALKSLGKYEVVGVDLKADSLEGVDLSGADKVYIALHGGWGESGGIQAELNKLRIPYTGPGAEASRIAMDKIATKQLLDARGIPTAPWAVVKADCAVCPLPLPVVVKPPCDGSSVGISKVAQASGWARALKAAKAAGSGEDILVEAFIPGIETTVGVIGGEALPVIEIVAKDGWYGYEEKYLSQETRYPFLEDPVLCAELKRLALAACEAIGCRGVTRVDFRVTPEGKCYVLELNTSPGFTSHSLVPKAGMKTGLSFAGVCDKILGKADYDHE